MNNKNGNQKAAIGVASDAFSLIRAVKEVIVILPLRAQDMLLSRFGINQKRPLTLEEIGKKYGVTRERVRQIIRESLKKIKSIKNNQIIESINEKVQFTIAQNGGIMKESDLLESVAGKSTGEKGALKLFLEGNDEIELIEETEDVEAVYVVKGFSFDKLEKTVAKVKEILQSLNEAIVIDKILEKSGDGEFLNEKDVSVNFLSVSKKIVKNNFRQKEPSNCVWMAPLP